MKKTLFIIGLLICLSFKYAGFAQSAVYLPEFTSEFDLKSEATLKVGLAIPVGSFKSSITGDGLAQGAKMGTAFDFSYNYYFVPYFGLGLVLGGQWFSYDFNTALNGLSYNGKLKNTGWQVYTTGLSLNVRVPLVKRLYLIGKVEGLFGIMASPGSTAVEKIERKDEDGKKLKPQINRERILRPETRIDFVLGGEFGAQYRIIKNVLVQLTVGYRYFVSNNSANNQKFEVSESPNLEFRYSAFSVNLGVSYAF